MARWRNPLTPEHLQQWPIRIAAWGLAILAIYQLFRFGGQVMQSQQLEYRIAQEQTAIALLEAEQQQLQGELDYAQSDAAVERLAREQLDLVYPEDRVLHIITAVPEPTSIVSATPTLIQPTPTAVEANWRGWWDAVFRD